MELSTWYNNKTTHSNFALSYYYMLATVWLHWNHVTSKLSLPKLEFVLYPLKPSLSFDDHLVAHPWHLLSFTPAHLINPSALTYISQSSPAFLSTSLFFQAMSFSLECLQQVTSRNTVGSFYKWLKLTSKCKSDCFFPAEIPSMPISLTDESPNSCTCSQDTVRYVSHSSQAWLSGGPPTLIQVNVPSLSFSRDNLFSDSGSPHKLFSLFGNFLPTYSSGFIFWILWLPAYRSHITTCDW